MQKFLVFFLCLFVASAHGAENNDAGKPVEQKKEVKARVSKGLKAFLKTIRYNSLQIGWLLGRYAYRPKGEKFSIDSTKDLVTIVFGVQIGFSFFEHLLHEYDIDHAKYGSYCLVCISDKLVSNKHA